MNNDNVYVIERDPKWKMQSDRGDRGGDSREGRRDDLSFRELGNMFGRSRFE